MKLIKLILSGAIILGMVACNSDDGIESHSKKDATVSLKITQVGTRAISTSTLATEESNIKKIDVFVFNGNLIDGHKQVTSPTTVTEVNGVEVTTGTRSLVVVANSSVDLTGISTKTDLLETVAADLADETLEKGLLMTSEETESFTLAAGENFYGYADNGSIPAENKHSIGVPVKLQRVAARIALVSLDTQFTGSYDGYEFELAEVFLFNAKKQSKLFGESLVKGTEYLSGINLDLFNGALKPSGWVAEWEVPYLRDDFTGSSDIGADNFPYYYTFENDASVVPTVISLKGKLKDASGNYVTEEDLPGSIDTEGFTYYSIEVNATKGGYTYNDNSGEHDSKILRNTQYNISILIKHGGKKDPTDPPLEPAELNVYVEVVPWLVVNQNVEY